MESSFPSLTVRADTLVPRGSFAEAQAEYLHPDPDEVRALAERCEATKTGIVAHFYMDAELQGALVAVGAPHTFIADSLQMADSAVKMAEAGKERILVLGVDFMSENVRAVLATAGATLDDVVAVTAYLADIDDWAEFNETYRATFRAPYPTRTTVGAHLHGFLVEVSAIACRPRS